MKRDHLSHYNTQLFCVFIGFLLLASAFWGCERRMRGVTELRKGEWFVAEDIGVAMKFESDGKILKGQYVMINQETSPIYTFVAERRRQKWVFSFDGHPRKKLQGVISGQAGGYVVQDRGEMRVILQPAPQWVFPRIPGRYSSVITTRVNRTVRTYGYASGYYASKPVGDMSAAKYPEILLGVLSEVTANMFTDSVRLDMDIYAPAEDSVQERPLILLIHGGAFVVGDKRDSLQVKLATYFAQCGFVVASINYRMGYPFVPGIYAQLERCIYRAVQDVRASLRFLADNRVTYGINPDMVFVAGNSAGGFLSLFAAFLQDEERWGSTRGLLFGLRKDQGCLDCSTNSNKGKYRIAGVVNLWGGITDLDMISSDEKVPVLMVHGTADRIVPFGCDYPFNKLDPKLTSFFCRKVYGSEPVAERMRTLGYDVKLIAIPGGNHEPQNDDAITYPMMRREMSAFFHRIQSGTPLELRLAAFAASSKGAARYEVLNHRGEDLRWRCTGGIILRQDQQSVDVVWLQDAEHHHLTVATISSSGMVRTTVLDQE